MNGAAINIDEFAAVFGNGSIRVQLNWPRAIRECAVEEQFSCSRTELGRLYTPWYDRTDCVQPYRFAAPLRVHALEQRLPDGGPAERAREIAELTARFIASAQPVVLPLPAYHTGDTVILLDGTHRSIAAYRARADVRLLLYILHGPTDSEMLPDLEGFRGTGAVAGDCERRRR